MHANCNFAVPNGVGVWHIRVVIVTKKITFRQRSSGCIASLLGIILIKNYKVDGWGNWGNWGDSVLPVQFLCSHHNP